VAGAEIDKETESIAQVTGRSTLILFGFDGLRSI
jgi:hypothetical protein